MAISWTKTWSASDDGSILGGADLGNIQSDIDSGSSNTVSATFTSANLTAGVYTFTHNVGVKATLIQVYDNNSKKVQPDDVTWTNTTTASIDLSSYGTISGTWTAIAV